MTKQLLIFDLDGTLVDSTYDLLDSLNYAAEKLGYEKVSETEIPAMVGNGVRVLLTNAFGVEEGSDAMEIALAKFMEYYREHLTNRSQMYPNVMDTIKHFSFKKLAILSNKPDELVKPIVEELGLKPYMSFVLGATEGIAKKPSAEPLEYIMRSLNVSAAETVMVGDGDADIKAGKNAGVTTCALTYGFRSKEELQQLGPDFILDDFVELKQLF